ncbi:MAG: L-threonylcarbamoyladenylate synthase [Candidatus Hadarchaeales archaeon]
MTLVLKVDPQRPRAELIRQAAGLLREGGLVAFPTETVYGLGANALLERAVRRVFEVKGRPTTNPLTVHIADKDTFYSLVKSSPPLAERLIERFWPGPLTLLVPKSQLVPDAVTAGLPTVGMRMPSHPVSIMLITEAGVPLVAPSANLYGRPSPTSAAHVLEDLGGKIDAVIDGGEVEYGIESTILDLTSDPPTLLRPGPVTVEELEAVIGKVVVRSVDIPKGPDFERHYAPKSKLILVEGNPDKVCSKIVEVAEKYQREGKRVGILATAENAGKYRAGVVKVVGSRSEPGLIAARLFKVLREFDKEQVDVILAEGLEPSGIGLAFTYRLREASSEILRV